MDKEHVKIIKPVPVSEQELITGTFPEGDMPVGLIIDCIGYTPRFKKPIIRASLNVFCIPADAIEAAF